jgi:hypothetical protein
VSSCVRSCYGGQGKVSFGRAGLGQLGHGMAVVASCVGIGRDRASCGGHGAVRPVKFWSFRYGMAWRSRRGVARWFRSGEFWLGEAVEARKGLESQVKVCRGGLGEV